MAILQSDKQLNLAQRMVNAAVAFDDLLVDMEQMAEEFPHAGAMTDAIFETSGELRHVNANDIATLIAAFANLIGWIDEAGQFRRDIYRKVRP